MEIQREAKTTMLFISHDLSVVRYIADRVVVMYLGHIVEQGTTDDIFSPPYHPYTEALLSAIPIADTSVEKKHIVLEGDIPSAMDPPSGCPFQTRCPRKAQVDGDLCEREVPPMRELASGHFVKCHLAASVLDAMEPVIVLGENKTAKTAIAKALPSKKTTARKSKASSASAANAKTASKAKSTAAKAKPGAATKASTAAGIAGVASVAAGAASAGSKAKAKPKAKATAKAPTRKAATAKPDAAKAAVKPASKPTTKRTASATKKTAPAKKDNAPPRVRKPAKPDDLKMISGVGPKIEGILHGLGVYKFEQVAKWKKAERDWVDDHLKFKGRIDRDDWVKQAKALAKGGAEEYIKVFGKKPR